MIKVLIFDFLLFRVFFFIFKVSNLQQNSVVQWSDRKIFLPNSLILQNPVANLHWMEEELLGFAMASPPVFVGHRNDAKERKNNPPSDI